MDITPRKSDLGNQTSEDFHLKLQALTSEAYMIVHRQLCDGISKGWNQDPAYDSDIWGTFEPSAFLSSFN